MFCQKMWIVQFLLRVVILFLVAEDTLLDMKLAMTEKVGMVHQMPYVCTRKNFASNAEKVCWFVIKYSKTCVKGPLSKRPKKCFLRPIIA